MSGLNVQDSLDVQQNPVKPSRIPSVKDVTSTHTFGVAMVVS